MKPQRISQCPENILYDICSDLGYTLTQCNIIHDLVYDEPDNYSVYIYKEFKKQYDVMTDKEFDSYAQKRIRKIAVELKEITQFII